MPIEFHHDAPVAALATLAQQAGAVDASRKRRTEIEAMNMQMVKMQKQEQQQNLNRVFDAWRTQYSEASAMQKMKAEHQFRDVQRDKAEAQQMKGWELQQGGMDRRQEAGNVAAMKHQQEQYRLRGDEASIKAADDMNHDIITAVGRGLNSAGRGQITGLMQQIAKIRGSQKIDPKTKPEEINKIMQQIMDLGKDPGNTVTLPGEDGYREDLGPVSRVTKGGQEHYVPNYHPKQGWGPGMKAIEEQFGVGETRDINNDGVPDQVSTAVWEFDDLGQPKMTKRDWVDIKPGAPEKTRFEIDRERGTFFKSVLEQDRGVDGETGALRLSPGAPPELRKQVREAQRSPFFQDKMSPEDKNETIENIVEEYYDSHVSGGAEAPEAPEAPGAPGDPAQEDIQVRPEDLQRGRDDLVKGADQRIHRALATGDRPGAKLVDRYQKIASDPNMDPATKQAELQRILVEQTKRLEESPEFRDLKDRGEPIDMQRMPDRGEPVDMQMLGP